MKFTFFIPYLTGMAVSSVCFLVIYATGQQNLRRQGNDPQVQWATDIRNRLESGQSAKKWLEDSIDLSRSLGTFVILYDKNRRPVQSTGFIEEKFPNLPAGILDYVNTHGEDRISWQPRGNIRVAMIVMSVNSPSIGFVAVGRSLKEVEERTSNLLQMVFLGWLFAMGLIFLAAVFIFKFSHH